jgi:hypothetical protein
VAKPLLSDVFIEMGDTLVDDFDLIDFLHLIAERCVQVLDVSEAGLLLTDDQGTLRLVAASSERTRLLELFQLQIEQGPCVDCFHTGAAVSVVDVRTASQWPTFRAAAIEIGFASVYALPMRLRSEVIGAVNLFDIQPGPLDAERLRIGQALADVATIGLLQQREIQRRDVITEQLQTALTGRVLIEQAKGLVAERLGVNVTEAFTMLRSTARSSNRRLSELAEAIIEGTEQLPANVSAPKARGPKASAPKTTVPKANAPRR